jgi:UTP--glucose-1-phosphate uridylyltransferase
MKAVIPAAGLGTRLLPVTKTVPKELLPIKGKPAIQWAIEEAVGAGLRDLIIVVSPRKAMIRQYLTRLDKSDPLSGYTAVAELEDLLGRVRIAFVEQIEPGGLGHAVLCCRELVENEPFALILPDNVFAEDSNCLKRLIAAHESNGKSWVGIWKADQQNLADGAVIAEPIGGSTFRITRVLEKRSSSGAISDLRPVGRYVLQPRALDFFERAGSQLELDDVPALDGLAREGMLSGIQIVDEFIHIGAALRHPELAFA